MSKGQAIAARIISRIYLGLSPALKQHTANIVSFGFEEIIYRRLSERGFRPDAIIDVGAYEGNWTKLALAVFGEVPSLMVEAQQGKKPILDAVVADHPKTGIALSALSETSGKELTFYEMSTGSSLRAEVSNAARTTTTVVTRTLDEVAHEHLPDAQRLFLKIDVQGAELDVLRGGAETLARCDLVQLELAMLQYNDGAPLLPEVVAFMNQRGFLPIEVSGFSRPREELVQIDMLFAREGSALRPTSFGF